MLETIIETKALAHALTFANSVVEKRNIIPELSNIKLTAKDNSVLITATDMDLYLSQNIGAQVIKEGEITVSTQTLTDIVKRIPDQEIKLCVAADEAKQLEVIAKNCHFNLLTLPSSQFPVMEELETESILKVSCQNFVRIIDYTQFSVSLEETRYNLNGIYLHVKGGELYAASTDGHRLSVASVAIDNAKEFGVILPRKTVDEIVKIIKDPKNIQLDLEIYLSVNKIKFTCNNIVLISKLIDGTFPDYSAFIPLENKNKLIINSKVLADVVERIATITVDKFRAIKMLLTPALIEITASGEARGSGKEKIICSKEENNLCEFNGDNIAIGFNPKYLLDVLNAIKNNQIELYFHDSVSPVLIKIKNSPKDIFVIMPVKV